MFSLESITLLIVGFIGGFLGSEVGAGGMIMLPALLFMGLSPAVAVATHVLAGWVTNAVAGYEYLRGGRVQNDVVFHLAPVAFVGAIVGSWLIAMIDSARASSIIAVLFAVVFLLIFVVFRKGIAGLRAGSQRYTHTRKLLAGLGAFILGVYGGFFSVGVTTLFIVLIVFILRRDFKQAAADAIAISSIFLLGSLVQFAGSGLIVYSMAIPLAVGAAVGAYYGSRSAMRHGNRWLKFLVMAVVIVAIIKLSYSAFASN